jgi:cobalt-zinc-cadmium efflux system outer membrane protein
MNSLVIGVIVATVLGAAGRAYGGLSQEDAVSLAMQRNRDVIAAQLDLKGVEVDKIAARVYPNPVVSYQVSNMVLGQGNAQGQGLSPSFGDQLVHTVAVSEIIDIWAKRNTRIRSAERGIERQRLLLEDALREIAYAVRSAYADVLREQSEYALAKETQARYDETIRLTRARRAAGDISESELKKIELEGMRYQNATIDAEMQLDLARQKIAGLLAMPSAATLPSELAEAPLHREPLLLDPLIQRALEERPDARALIAEKRRAEAELTQARREAFPDISLGVAYTHSNFTVSGDNPNSLSLSLSLPLPVFDRNQAAIARAHVDLMRAQNDAAKIELQIRHEVADAVRKQARSAKLVGIYEGGMTARAEAALQVAEKSYRAGAVSLLELLEAQRTYLETRGAYLNALYDYRQAHTDVVHAVGGEPN